jgi:hypothetical protein
LIVGDARSNEPTYKRRAFPQRASARSPNWPARQLDPTIHAGLGRLSILFRLRRISGLLEEDLKKAVTMLTELRLIAPGDVADSAQRVIYTAFAQEITAAIAPNQRHRTTEAFNREINDLVL